jgi:pyruvate,orthophosphate dikinase
MRWIHPLSPETAEPADVLGGKAHGLAALRRLGLSVPPGFVIGTEACRAFLRQGRLPDGLEDELAAAVAELEATTRRTFGGPEWPLAVSVRSGGSVSMPGMMATILNLGLTVEATAGLAAETGEPRFAGDSRRRFLTSLAAATADSGPIPDDAMGQLRLAVAAVFRSWDTPRATTYRELQGIPHDLGTAVTVQAMVFGNRDDHSGAGVAFSRNPSTGARVPFGEVLFGRQGDDVVSGGSLTRPLDDLADREPAVWAGLVEALRRVEEHDRDACYLEFTFEVGELWLLQARPGRFVGAAAVRVAVDLADEGVIGRDEALLRVSPRHLQLVRIPRVVDVDEADVLARGLGAVPGVAVGRVATTADRAVRMVTDGPVILVRPATSPLDLRGLAAAAGVVTGRGGPASHAAVVARAMGKPAVVGVAGLTVADTSARAGARRVPEGTTIAIDGTGGEVVMGTPRVETTAADPHLRRLLQWADEVSGDNSTGRDEAGRLGAAHAVLRRGASIP